MIVDISDWGLNLFHTWGIFSIRSQEISRGVSDIFDYCASLDPEIVNITFISSNNLAGANHAYLASYFANRAIRAKYNIAKDFGMEMFLYLSGQNQIFIAKESFGIDDAHISSGLPCCVVMQGQSEITLLAAKDSLEQFLNSPIGDFDEAAAVLHFEDIAANLGLSPLYLGVMQKLTNNIPQLPVAVLDPRELALLQALIERMVALSLDAFKWEF